jgi:hypothetical protein
MASRMGTPKPSCSLTDTKTPAPANADLSSLSETLGLGPDLGDVVRRRGIADQHQSRLLIEGPVVLGEGGDQVVLALVPDDPPDVEPVVGSDAGPGGCIGKLAEVDSDRQHLDPAESDGQHLPAVEVGIGDAEQRAAGKCGELFAPEPDVTACGLVVEVVLRRDVVIHGHDVVGERDDVVKGVIPHRVVQEEEVRLRTPVSVHQADTVLEARRDVLGEDLGFESQLTQKPLQLEHLVGDRISHSRSGMELVDCPVLDHLEATMT